MTSWLYKPLNWNTLFKKLYQLIFVAPNDIPQPGHVWKNNGKNMWQVPVSTPTDTKIYEFKRRYVDKDDE